MTRPRLRIDEMRYFLGALLLAAAACRKSDERAHPVRLQIMEGLTINQSESGAPSWTLKSSRALLHEDSKRATLTEPVMEFYKNGKAVSRVTALTGEVETASHDVHLSSSVVMDSFEDNSRLTTSELFYNSARARFTTTADVLIRRPEGLLRGKGLEATPDLSEVRIFNQNSTLSAPPR